MIYEATTQSFAFRTAGEHVSDLGHWIKPPASAMPAHLALPHMPTQAAWRNIIILLGLYLWCEELWLKD
jgi:hypothetical protein